MHNARVSIKFKSSVMISLRRFTQNQAYDLFYIICARLVRIRLSLNTTGRLTKATDYRFVRKAWNAFATTYVAESWCDWPFQSPGDYCTTGGAPVNIWDTNRTSYVKHIKTASFQAPSDSCECDQQVCKLLTTTCGYYGINVQGDVYKGNS